MIQSALDFWNAIKGKIQQLIEELSQNCLRIERYDVSAAPSNGKIGVKQPFGKEIFIKYNNSAQNVQVGDTVYVIWWHSMSNATAWYFDGSDSPTPPPTPTEWQTVEPYYEGEASVEFGGYKVSGKTVTVTVEVSLTQGMTSTQRNILKGFPQPEFSYASLSASLEGSSAILNCLILGGRLMLFSTAQIDAMESVYINGTYTIS